MVLFENIRLVRNTRFFLFVLHVKSAGLLPSEKTNKTCFIKFKANKYVFASYSVIFASNLILLRTLTTVERTMHSVDGQALAGTDVACRILWIFFSLHLLI